MNQVIKTVMLIKKKRKKRGDFAVLSKPLNVANKLIQLSFGLYLKIL